MTTKEKLKILWLTIQGRKMFGCKNLLDDDGRRLKAEVYQDVISRHPNVLKNGKFPRVVRAVNNILAI